MKFIKERNPTLSPAINRIWLESRGRAEAIAIYRIYQSGMTRLTVIGARSISFCGVLYRKKLNYG
ncbi:hypothetical protein Cal6303_2823 [Calothrix sp. PCC 6303]|nr:hypothetical protein Cal6303_2823 [Calothrix sp. PCC 6303]